jgi:hypothetical protein
MRSEGWRVLQQPFRLESRGSEGSVCFHPAHPDVKFEAHWGKAWAKRGPAEARAPDTETKTVVNNAAKAPKQETEPQRNTASATGVLSGAAPTVPSGGFDTRFWPYPIVPASAN